MFDHLSRYYVPYVGYASCSYHTILTTGQSLCPNVRSEANAVFGRHAQSHQSIVRSQTSLCSVFGERFRMERVSGGEPRTSSVNRSYSGRSPSAHRLPPCYSGSLADETPSREAEESALGPLWKISPRVSSPGEVTLCRRGCCAYSPTVPSSISP